MKVFGAYHEDCGVGSCCRAEDAEALHGLQLVRGRHTHFLLPLQALVDNLDTPWLPCQVCAIVTR
jgi:hypothetical protein